MSKSNSASESQDDILPILAKEFISQNTLIFGTSHDKKSKFILLIPQIAISPM